MALSSSKRRLSAESLSNLLPAKRRTITDIMHSKSMTQVASSVEFAAQSSSSMLLKRLTPKDIMLSKSKLTQPAPSIDSAIQLIPKLEYASDYTNTTQADNDFLNLHYDIHSIILHQLTSERVYEIVAHMYLDNGLKALRRVNNQMNAMVRQWMKSVTKCKVKQPQLPYLETSPMPPQLKYHISPAIGMFESRTTTFFLNAAFMENPSEADLAVESRLIHSRMLKFVSSDVHQVEVRHVKLTVRSIADFMLSVDFLRCFQNLQSLEITVLGVASGQITESPNHFGHYIWDIFWRKQTRWCHPGNVCSCCNLPEIKILELGTNSSSEAHVIPGPLPFLDDMEEREVLIARRTERWFNRDGQYA